MKQQEQLDRQPIRLHPDNPNYFLYQGKPTVLITSSEDYGSILNLDFDYCRFFEELQRHGLNHARVFSGVYREIQNVSFGVEGNAVAPRDDRYLCPWLRLEQAGATNESEQKFRYDLDQWDESYFVRMKDYLAEAEKRGIVIEFVFFCSFYHNYFGNDLWSICPLEHQNNINNTERVTADAVYRLENKKLLEVEVRMLTRIVEELNGFGNLFYEVINEPWNDQISLDWQRYMIQVIVDTEQKLPARHLISTDLACGYQRIEPLLDHVSIYNFHYATGSSARENLATGKAIGLNETGFCGPADEPYRIQAWEFMMSGGALYNNIDYSFSPGYEDGSFPNFAGQPGGGSTALRQQLGFLKAFLDSLDLISMTPDCTPMHAIFANYPSLFMIHSERAYAGYIRSSGVNSIDLALPTGSYQVEWLDPVACRSLQMCRVSTVSHKLHLDAPSGSDQEIVFKIMRLAEDT